MANSAYLGCLVLVLAVGPVGCRSMDADPVQAAPLRVVPASQMVAQPLWEETPVPQPVLQAVPVPQPVAQPIEVNYYGGTYWDPYWDAFPVGYPVHGPGRPHRHHHRPGPAASLHRGPHASSGPALMPPPAGRPQGARPAVARRPAPRPPSTKTTGSPRFYPAPSGSRPPLARKPSPLSRPVFAKPPVSRPPAPGRRRFTPGAGRRR